MNVLRNPNELRWILWNETLVVNFIHLYEYERMSTNKLTITNSDHRSILTHLSDDEGSMIAPL
jgi:hypothetical protein